MNFIQTSLARLGDAFKLAKNAPNEPAPNGEKKRISAKLKRQKVFLATLDQDQLRLAIEIAQNPYNPNRYYLLAFYKECEKNLRLLSQMRTAINKVIKEPWAVVDAKTGEMKPELTKLLQKKWFEELCKSVLQAEFYGHSLVEFGAMYPAEDAEKVLAEYVFKDISLIPREHVRPETGELLINPMDTDGIPYREAPFNTWLIEAGNPDDLGLLMYCARYMIYKKYTMSDWSRSSEKWSDPLLVIKSASDDEKENNKKEEFAANFGNNGYVILDDDDEATLLQRTSGGTSHLIYQDFLKYNDDEIAQGINGQTGSADEKAFVGSAEVHERILGDYTEERLRSLMYYINETVFPFLIEKGYKLEGFTFKPLQFMLEMRDPNEVAQEAAIQKQNEIGGGGAAAKKHLRLSSTFSLYQSTDCDCPDCTQLKLAYQSPYNIDTLINASIERIYNRKLQAGDNDAELFKANATKLTQGVAKGWEKPFKLDKQSRVQLELMSNVTVFSAFKNHKNVADMVAQLRNPDGTVRTFSAFKKAVKPIAENYNKRYLEAEYNTAVTSARSANLWHTFPDDAMLTYTTVQDGRVREEHAALQGTTYPKSHSFWQTWYPPNGWRCRCTVRAKTSDTPEKAPNGMPDKMPPEMFRQNVGLTKEIFNGDSPFIKEAGAEEGKKIMAVAKQWVISAERKIITKAAKEELKDKAVTLVLPTGEAEAGFNVKEIINQPHDDLIEKNRILLDWQELKNATYLKAMPDVKNRRDVVQFHYLLYKEKYYLNIMELKNGKYVIYSITDHLK